MTEMDDSYLHKPDVMSVYTRELQQDMQTDCCVAQNGVGRTILREKSLQPRRN